MKIAVVNYSEMNPCPGKEQVIDDICRLYSCASKDFKEDMGIVLNEQLTNLSCQESQYTDCDICFINTSTHLERVQLKSSIDSYKPDLLVSYNLAGFELSTLTDSLLYNLIDCRQFHIINRKDLPNQQFLHILRSINLFIFEDYKDKQ